MPLPFISNRSAKRKMGNAEKKAPNAYKQSQTTYLSESLEASISSPVKTDGLANASVIGSEWHSSQGSPGATEPLQTQHLALMDTSVPKCDP